MHRFSNTTLLLSSAMLGLALMACTGPAATPEGPSTPVKQNLPEVAVDLDLGATLATVDGVTVGSKEYGLVAARRIPKDGAPHLSDEEKKELLDELIDQKLLYMEARRLGLDQDPKVQRQMIQILLRKTVYSQVRNTDFTNEELRAYYEKEKDNFTTPEKLLIRRIFVKVDGVRPEDEAMRIAKQALERVKKDPESFATVAQEVSEDIFQKRGGDLGYVPRSGKANVPDEVVAKAFELPLNQPSEPFVVDGGVNIVMGVSRRDKVERTFEQVKGAVLRKAKGERHRELIDKKLEELRGEMTVERFPEELEKLRIEAPRPINPFNRPPGVAPINPPPPPPMGWQGQVSASLRALVSSIAPAALLLLWAPSAVAGLVVDGVACVVNDEVITLSEVYEVGGPYIQKKCGVLQPGVHSECVAAAENEVSDTLIMQKLVQQKLAEVDMDVKEQTLERSIDQIMRDNGIETHEQFRAALLQQGLSWDAYRAQLRNQLRTMTFRQTFLQPLVSISDDEVRDAYNRAARQFTTEDRLSLSYLSWTMPQGASDADVLTVRVELEEAMAAGKSFDDLKSVVSTVEPREAQSAYRPSELIEQFKPVLELEEGGMGGPWQIGNSWFVVRVDKVTAGQVLEFDQVEGKLRQQLMEQRIGEEAEQWYVHAKRSAAVRCTFDDDPAAKPGGAEAPQ